MYKMQFEVSIYFKFWAFPTQSKTNFPFFLGQVLNYWAKFFFFLILVGFSSCKVEFYQPSCWFYSLPNLIVFQQLVTLYLDGILVKVVSEIVWRNAQECARKIGTRDWILLLQATKSYTHARHTRSWSVVPARALQDKIGQLAIQLPRGWNLRLSQATRPSREAALFWKTWLFTFYSHPSINILIPTKEWELPERILREKP